jgi:hypothetical protein
MVAADLNQDDELDLIIGQGSGGDTLAVLLGLGSGAFGAPVSYPAGASVFHVCAGDVNGDGKVDIAAATATPDTLAVLLGDGLGGLGSPINYGAGQGPRCVVLEDLNDDGRLDAVVANGGGAAADGTVSISLNQLTAVDPWSNLASGLAGVHGVPALVGTGRLVPGADGSLNLTDAAPSALANLFIALGSTPAPFKCGTLVPVPVASTVILMTDGHGAIPLSWTTWPWGLSGANLYFQYAIQDAGAACGVALSNALRADVP